MTQTNKKKNILNIIARSCINFYQKTLSPDSGFFSPRLAGTICAHSPRCSEYGKRCYEQYTFLQATGYTMERIMSCTGSTKKTYDPAVYRVVFCSGSPLGIPFLEELFKDPRFEIVGGICPEQKKQGRGQKLTKNIIGKSIHDLEPSIPVITPRSLRLGSKKYKDDALQAKNWLEDIHPDFLVVVAYGKILPSWALQASHFGPINVHGSILPKYRGASPLQQVFLDQRDESGLTIMEMVEGLDEGPMIDTLITKLAFDRTILDFIGWIKENGPSFLADTLREYGKGRLSKTEQNHSQSSHCSKIQKEQAQIDIYTDSLEDVYRQYRAFTLWPKIYFVYKGKRFIIQTLRLDQEEYARLKGSPCIGLFGTNTGTLNTLNPSIQSITIKPEGKKELSRTEFTSGYGQIIGK